jgi:hypothetical protein
MQRVRIGVEGSGVLGSALVERGSDHHGVDVHAGAVTADVVVRCIPALARTSALEVPSIVPSLTQADAAGPGDVTVAGFWGGLGSLLAAVAVAEATVPRAVHVAYGFPGARRLLGQLSPTLRQELVVLATGRSLARVHGESVPEPLGEGRRLAWFPQPVGPAHAVAVGGVEHRGLEAVPTVRTWVAARSLAAEVLQAIGRWDPASGPGGWLHRRAAAAGGGPGATADVRWAVVVECLDGDGSIVRAWANGTDPVRAAADLLLVAAARVGAGAIAADRTVAGLGDARQQLDDVADLRTLRWSVSRPEPARR